MKFTKKQREHMWASIDILIGILITFFIYEFAGDLARKIVQSVIIWFMYFTVASALCIFIYNSLKNK